MLLRTRRSVSWQRDVGLRGSGVPHADKEQAVSAVAGRSREVAGVRAVGRSWRRAGMDSFCGLDVTAEVPEVWRAVITMVAFFL